MTPRTFSITTKQLASCPIRSMLPAHWNEDGTCLCFKSGWYSGSVRFGRGASIATRTAHWIVEGGVAACGATPREPLHPEPAGASPLDRCETCAEKRWRR